jgi:hypothetical protein
MNLVEIVSGSSPMDRIRRSIWNTQFLTIPMDKTDSLYFCDKYNLDGCVKYIPLINDLVANDWIKF